MPATQEPIPTPGFETPQTQSELATSVQAFNTVISALQAFELSGDLPNGKAAFVVEVTEALGTASRSDHNAMPLFRSNPHMQTLGIKSPYIPRLELDRQLHDRVFTYLSQHNQTITDSDRSDVRALAHQRDQQQRLATMGSYAQHGLLTFGEAERRGLLGVTSSTPNEIYNPHGLLGLDSDGGVLGFMVPNSIMPSPFSDAEGFYLVAMERGWELMSRTFRLPPSELENRIKNSMLFVVRAETVPDRSGTSRGEDVIARSIPPEQISYVVVGGPNVALAQQAFADTPIEVVEAPAGHAKAAGSDKLFAVYDFESVVRDIVARDGKVWCHIVRLKEDTYPPGFESVTLAEVD